MGFFSWVMSVSTTDYWNGFVDALVLTGHDVRALFNVLAERMKMEATDASNEGVDGLAEDPSGEGAVSHTDEGTVSRMKEATESVDVLEPVPEGGTQLPTPQFPTPQFPTPQFPTIHELRHSGAYKQISAQHSYFSGKATTSPGVKLIEEGGMYAIDKQNVVYRVLARNSGKKDTVDLKLTTKLDNNEFERIARVHLLELWKKKESREFEDPRDD